MIHNDWLYLISVVSQEYITYAHNVQVIIGNSALFKCEIPSFVTDLVTVVSWSDHEKNEYFLSGSQSLGSVFLSIVLWDTRLAHMCQNVESARSLLIFPLPGPC